MSVLNTIQLKHSELTTIIRNYIESHGTITLEYHEDPNIELRLDGIYDMGWYADQVKKVRELHEMDWEELGKAMCVVQETLETKDAEAYEAAPEQEIRVLAMTNEQRIQAIKIIRGFIDDSGGKTVPSRCLFAFQGDLQDWGKMNFALFSDESVIVKELPFPQYPTWRKTHQAFDA